MGAPGELIQRTDLAHGRVGVGQDLVDNIHDQMLAYLLVTDAAWYGRTSEAGSWSAEVPRGRYRVELWHPRLRDTETDLARELTVGDGDRAADAATDARIGGSSRSVMR